MFANSIRWQIQAWHGALLILITASLLTAFFSYERKARITRLDEQLQAAFVKALPALRSDARRRPDGPGRPPSDTVELLLGGFPFDDPPPEAMRRHPPFDLELEREFVRSLSQSPMFYSTWNERREVTTASANAPKGIPLPDESLEPGANINRSRDGYREFIHYRPGGEIILFGMSLAPVDAAMKRLGFWLAGIGVGVVAAGLLGGWWLASRAMRPIAAISSTAETIAAGDLSKRIDVVGTKSELGDLAVVLNNTFDRLQRAFDQQVQFTADASHELRTPISVILSQSELALSREREPAEYREALDVCRRSGERMRGLVAALLELARFDSGEQQLFRERCDLAELVQESIDLVRPLAGKKQVSISASLQPAAVFVDGHQCHHVFTNLLANAIHHNPDGTEIRVRAGIENGEAVVKVSDTGKGIAAVDLPHIFERFYRADKARSRANGSSGLGLAIAKAIIEAHGGTIIARSEEGKGTEFVVRLPVSDPRSV